jgi:amidophosphoribosyltransferase
VRHPAEYCGLCGIIGAGKNTIPYLAEGLHSLQHRGQEAAGVLAATAGGLRLHKKKGLVSEALSDLPGWWLEESIPAAIGHNRYGTFGGTSVLNAQPILVNMAGFQVGIAHNGTISNASTIRKELQRRGAIFQTNTDTEVVLHLMSSQLSSTGFDLENTMELALDRLRGAFCLLVMTTESMYAVRDPLGFRPLCLGRLPDGGWMVASESIAFPICGAEYVREVEAGEILGFRFGEEEPFSIRFGIDKSLFEKDGKLAQCIFEHVYFARPGSTVFGDSVYAVRIAMGAQLARESPVDCDIVMPVPDSGMFAALGFSRELGIPFDMGFTRNHYVGRTFIDPTAATRSAMVMRKLQPITEAIRGRRVCVVEDSIVRGTTSTARIDALRQAGAREVHMRVSCPPHRFGCYFGIDFPERTKLAAHERTIDEVCGMLGLDSLGYLSLDGMLSCVSAHAPEDYCTACFSGCYPVDPPEEGIPRRGDGQ